MKQKSKTEAAIEDLVTATCGMDATVREKHVFREALRNLVRLAKSEQTVEVKASVEKLASAAAVRSARKQTKALILAHRFGAASGSSQAQLQFN